jgi:asparaginyl-tRNA synthetase
MQKKRHSLEFLREVAHLRARSNTIGAVARVRNCLANAVHEFFQQRGFLYLHTPIITGSDCEGRARCSPSPHSIRKIRL